MVRGGQGSRGWRKLVGLSDLSFQFSGLPDVGHCFSFARLKIVDRTRLIPCRVVLAWLGASAKRVGKVLVGPDCARGLRRMMYGEFTFIVSRFRRLGRQA